MDIERLCAGIKERVALEMQGTAEPATRQELLTAALSDIGRVVFPALVRPGELRQFRRCQDPVLELVSAVAVPLIKEGDPRGEAALLELAEACPDAVIKKKLLLYAKELRHHSCCPGDRRTSPAGTVARLAGLVALAVSMFYILLPYAAQEQPRQAAPRQSTQRTGATGASRQEPIPAVPPQQDSEGDRKAPAAEPASPRSERSAPAVSALPCAEPVTKVRIVDDQVLVPVTVKHGAGTVRLELVLDTGSTRTALHDTVAGRLAMDLRFAKPALAELADGRTVRSKITTVDSLVVGPYAHSSMEVELISYSGNAGMHDGLLGMDFLRKHRYQIDMEREVIRWF